MKKLKDVTFGEIAKLCSKEDNCTLCSCYKCLHCIVADLIHNYGLVPADWLQDDVLDQEVDIKKGR